MCIDLVKGRTWLQSLNTTAKCGTVLLCHISPFRISHLPKSPPPRYLAPPTLDNVSPVNKGHSAKVNSKQ